MWTAGDLEYIKKNYPLLKLKTPTTIEGQLFFQALRVNNQLVINPNPDLLYQYGNTNDAYICDGYEVRLVWEDESPLPIAYETAGKIKSVSERLGKPIIDMHLFPDSGALCLTSPVEIISALANHSIPLQIFIEKFLVPYLFAQSYYAKYEKWLWGELSHECWGLLEWLGRQNIFTEKDVIGTLSVIQHIWGEDFVKHLFASRCRSHKPCPCSSGKRTKNCHPDIKEGICRVRNVLSSKMSNLKLLRLPK